MVESGTHGLLKEYTKLRVITKLICGIRLIIIIYPKNSLLQLMTETLEKCYMYLGLLHEQPDILLKVKKEHREDIMRVLSDLKEKSSYAIIKDFVRVCALAKLTQGPKAPKTIIRGHDFGETAAAIPYELINWIAIKTEEKIKNIQERAKG